jgi:hypothetical protein
MLLKVEWWFFEGVGFADRHSVTELRQVMKEDCSELRGKMVYSI